MINALLLFYQPDSTRTDDLGYMIGYYAGAFFPVLVLFIISIFMFRAIRKQRNKE